MTSNGFTILNKLMKLEDIFGIKNVGALLPIKPIQISFVIYPL
jgi:hypothetical protein